MFRRSIEGTKKFSKSMASGVPNQTISQNFSSSSPNLPFTSVHWFQTESTNRFWCQSLLIDFKETRMHSSRMRTARLLPVSPSMYCSGGCLLRGVSGPGSGGRGVSAPGGLSGPRGPWSQGVSTPGGISAPNGGVPGSGVVFAQVLPCEQNSWHTQNFVCGR